MSVKDHGPPATVSSPPMSDHSPSAPAVPPPATRLGRPNPKRLAWIIGSLIVVAVAAWLITPHVRLALNTVSTDDAYVNGHVTSVAPRVAGQVAKVLVDDNYRVAKGDLLVQLDKEPYQVQLNVKQAMVDAAQADLVAAEA